MASKTGRPCRRRTASKVLPSGEYRSLKTVPPKPPISRIGFAVVVGVPDPDPVVLAAGGDALAVGRERDGVNRLGMSREGHQRLFLFDVEDLAGLVAAGAGQSLAVGGEGDGEDPVGVVLDLGQELAGLDLEDPDRPVGAGGGDLLAVGAESDREDDVLGLDEVADRLAAAARLGEPELGDAVDARVAAGGRQPLAVRAVGDVVDPLGQARSTGGRARRRPSSRT